MDQGLIPGRYAKALYKVAVERHCDESLYVMMKRLAQTFADNADLQHVMENPYVTEAQKHALLLTAAGIDKSSVATQDSVADVKSTPVDAAVATIEDFLKLLSRNRRIEYARGSALAYIAIYRQQHHIHTVNVTSARTLDDKTYGRVIDIVKRHCPDGVFETQAVVDPELIGGFTVTIDNERLDASVSNELKQLRLELLPNK